MILEEVAQLDVTIVEVHNTGELATEEIILTANKDCDLGSYLLTDSTYNELHKPSNKHRHVFFFPPDHKVKSGDMIYVHSHSGTNSVKPGARPSYNVHRFYWNLHETVWNKGGDVAHLLKAPRLQRDTKPIPPVK